MMPRFLADLTGGIVVLSGRRRRWVESLDNWLGRPMRRNSVLEGLSDRKLEVIHPDIAEIVSWRLLSAVGAASGRKEMKSCVSSAYKWWPTWDGNPQGDDWLIIVLSGVVYIMNSMGPRTEP